MNQKQPSRIAIVGCGFTGTTALYQLVDRYPVSEILVFEASGHFGPGYAYGAGNPSAYLINNTTDSMCLAPSNRRAFLDWLKTKPEFQDVDPKGHLPRKVFGRFLEDVIAATRVIAAIKNIDVQLRAEQVTDVREDASGSVTVSTDRGDTIVDCAILATGRCPSVDRLAERPAPGTRYFSSHIPGHTLDDIPSDATVHVLGASLSAYDVVNGLFAPATGCTFERSADGSLIFCPGSNRRHVVLASRTGRLKKVASRNRMAINRSVLTEAAIAARSKTGPLTLASLLDMVRDEAVAHGIVVDWSSVLEPYADCNSPEDVTQRAADLLARDLAGALAPADQKANFLVDLAVEAQLFIWQLFADGRVSADQEAIYRRQYESSVLTFTAPCPIATAERLLALMRAGRLSLLAGVRGVDVTPDGRYAIEHAHGMAVAETLINVTGAVDRRVDSRGQPPLYRNMSARGTIHPHDRGHGPLDGIAVDMRTFRPIGLKNIYVANMLLWGPGYFTSSAFLMATVVQRLLGAMYEER